MTNDTTVELVPCPFCGAGSTSIRENGKRWTGQRYSEPTSVSVLHHCDPVAGQPSRSIERVGRDLESAIAAWNDRVPAAPVQQGLQQWWKLVPLASTTDMRIAYQRNRDDGFDAAYRAMLADAPQPLEGAPVPQGWKLVPLAATADMRIAYQRNREDGFEAAYQALLAAAPQPPEAAPVELPKPDFHGFRVDDECRVDMCFTPHAPRRDGTFATGYYTEHQVRELLAAHGIREVSEWLRPTTAPAGIIASTEELEARLAKALEALESALKTANFERHPFRSWQHKAIEALALSGIKVDFPRILLADDGVLDEAQG